MASIAKRALCEPGAAFAAGSFAMIGATASPGHQLGAVR
jgi:hypothetical protein